MREILEGHPPLKELLADFLSSERLGGLTNQNLRVECPSGSYVLRTPGAGTSEYINRKAERHAALVTSKIGVNAKVIYFDETSGVQLCEFLENTITMSAERFKNLSSVGRAARAFRAVHSSETKFENRFELFQMIQNYLKILDGKDAVLPEGFAEARREADAVREALGRHELPLVPCHCDPLAENFLDDGEKMYLVDWEYAGNNDPMWDLGDLAVEASFDPRQEEALLAAYFAPLAPSDFDRARMVMYKAMCDLLWTLWGAIQHENGNTAEDFKAYAENRFARCRKLMQSAEFKYHLGVVARGPAAAPTLYQ